MGVKGARFQTETLPNDRESGGRPKRGLIPLSGNVAGKYPLVIEKPKVANLGLSFDREIK